MHKQLELKQLEDYLAEVARQLGPLPKERCRDELKEMRQHLLNAVIANQELGQPENVAVANALREFGTPAEAGANVLWAWRRQLRKVSSKMFWNMASIWSFFYVFMMVTSGHTPGAQERAFGGWAGTMAVSALFLLLLPYLRTKTLAPLVSSVQRHH